MKIDPPQLLLEIVGRFDNRSDVFDVGDLMSETDDAIRGMQYADDAERKSVWAEWAPWGFSTHDTDDVGGPWGTYFQPMMMNSNDAGEYRARPDLRTATPEIIEYWGKRAEEAKHPLLKARYADLVWDTTKFVTKKKPAIKFAHMAIDSYLAAAALDDGSAKFETGEGLTRALQLALKIKDKGRIDRAVDATVSFVERTADDDHTGTFCYMFDNLLPPEKGPSISPETAKRVIALLEAKFALMTTPGGAWDVDPHSPEHVGLRLASYYGRTQAEADRIRVLRAIAEAFERRAGKAAAILGMDDLQRAGELYIEAGLREEAERVRRQGQALGPEAEESMPTISVKHEIPNERVEEFRAHLTALGPEGAIHWLTQHFVPDQDELAKTAAEMAKKYPLQAMFKPVVLAHGHIAADVRDTEGDPDGDAAWRTSRSLQLQQHWLAWGFEHLFTSMGFTADQATAFIKRCPLYEEDRLSLIRAGLQAHLDEDYVKAVHVLVPQIEKAVVNLFSHVGKATNKAHRTGRGVMQSKNINDALADEAVSSALGPDLRMYLLSSLAHPKGLNIRNEVCHGLWAADQFTRIASERVLHALFAVSLLRGTPADGEGGAAPDNAGPDSKGDRSGTAH